MTPTRRPSLVSPRSRFAGAFLDAVALGSLLPTAATEATLENAAGRLVVRDGRIVSLLDETRSLEHGAAATARAPGLFQIQWVKGIQPAGTLDATAMESRIPAPGAGRWQATFYVGASPQKPQIVTAGQSLEWRLPSGRLASIVLTPANDGFTGGQIREEKSHEAGV